MSEFRYRDHRGMLSDSMRTVQRFSCFDDLFKHLSVSKVGSFCVEDVKVEHYGYDDRIGWDTYILTINGNAVGFTDGDVSRSSLDE